MSPQAHPHSVPCCSVSLHDIHTVPRLFKINQYSGKTVTETFFFFHLAAHHDSTWGTLMVQTWYLSAVMTGCHIVREQTDLESIPPHLSFFSHPPMYNPHPQLTCSVASTQYAFCITQVTIYLDAFHFYSFQVEGEVFKVSLLPDPVLFYIQVNVIQS